MYHQRTLGFWFFLFQCSLVRAIFTLPQITMNLSFLFSNAMAKLKSFPRSFSNSRGFEPFVNEHMPLKLIGQVLLAIASILNWIFYLTSKSMKINCRYSYNTRSATIRATSFISFLRETYGRELCHPTQTALKGKSRNWSRFSIVWLGMRHFSANCALLTAV